MVRECRPSVPTLLGQKAESPTSYAPEVLTPIPRQHPEVESEDALIRAVGYDAWHAWEASCLTKGGLPVVAVLKVVYSSDSPYLVESKSFKLYLHSPVS